jgi:hypothetical protein
MIFENVVFGNLNHYDLDLLKEISSYLSDKKINLYFLSGLNEDVGDKIVKKKKLTSIFKKENIFHVTNDYLLSLVEIDQEIRQEKYKISKDYIDQYFKIYFLTKLKPELNCEKTLFIGNDIWTDAYYIAEYTSSNVVLASPKITFNQEDYDKDLKTLTVIKNFNDFKKILENKTDFNYSKLKSFAKNYLVSKTIGKLDLNLDFEKIYKKS